MCVGGSGQALAQEPRGVTRWWQVLSGHSCLQPGLVGPRGHVCGGRTPQSRGFVGTGQGCVCIEPWVEHSGFLSSGRSELNLQPGAPLKQSSAAGKLKCGCSLTQGSSQGAMRADS